MFLVTPKVLSMVVLWEKKKTKTQVWRSYNWKQNIFLQIFFDVSMHFHISIKRKRKKKIYLLLCSKFKSFVGEKKKPKFGDHIIGSKKYFYKFALMFPYTSIFL